MNSIAKSLDASFFSETQKTYFWSKVKIGRVSECWPWLGGRTKRGYGKVILNKRDLRTSRVAFVLVNGSLLDGEITRHRCDHPPCCNPKHILKGSNLDNSRDMVERERQAKGDKHGSKTHPESVPKGDKNGARLHPERLARGVRHGSKTHPERLPRGKRNGRYTHPETTARGEGSGLNIHFDKASRGETQGNSKLTWKKVREIRKKRASGETLTSLAHEFGVSVGNIRLICLGVAWREDEDREPLDWMKVRRLRAKWNVGASSHTELAIEFGITITAARGICLNKLWKE